VIQPLPIEDARVRIVGPGNGEPTIVGALNADLPNKAAGTDASEFGFDF
jgi:hypothetical protein